jgi:hypothetical protein
LLTHLEMENVLSFVLINILLIGRSRNTKPVIRLWVLVSFHASQFCLSNLYDTVNDTVTVHHGSDARNVSRKKLVRTLLFYKSANERGILF